MNARLRTMIAGATLTCALLLSACGGAPSGPAGQTVEAWQARVVAIAEHAAEGDPAAGLQELALLEDEVVGGRDSGEISAERAALIQEAIILVRADLEAVSTETPLPESTGDPVDPVDGVDEDNGNSGNSGKNEKDEKDQKNPKSGKNEKGNGP